MGAITEARAAAALLILRLSLGVFLVQWSLEKIVVPESAIRVAQHFYGVAPTVGTTIIVGMPKRCSLSPCWSAFGADGAMAWAVLVHAVSVISTWRQLLSPYAGSNHLFIDGVPVLAAFVLLYLLREWHAYSVDGCRKRQTIIARA